MCTHISFGVASGALAIAFLSPAPFNPTSQAPVAVATIQSNEHAAIDTLRMIAAAQSRFQRSASIDTNCDGVGEFGYLAELSGKVQMRSTCSWPCSPCAGLIPQDVLDPPLLPESFRVMRHSVVLSRGYLFQVWLPAPMIAGAVAGVQEDWIGGKMAAPFPDPDTGSRYWCCYAWPAVRGQTGERAFFIDERELELETPNRAFIGFSGPWAGPWYDEAFSVAGDMASSPAINAQGQSGALWRPVP